jgi:hypothetical protein
MLSTRIKIIKDKKEVYDQLAQILTFKYRNGLMKAPKVGEYIEGSRIFAKKSDDCHILLYIE